MWIFKRIIVDFWSLDLEYSYFNLGPSWLPNGWLLTIPIRGHRPHLSVEPEQKLKQLLSTNQKIQSHPELKVHPSIHSIHILSSLYSHSKKLNEQEKNQHFNNHGLSEWTRQRKFTDDKNVNWGYRHRVTFNI